MTEAETIPPASSNSKRKRALLLASSIFLGLGILYLVYWIAYGRFYIHTSDAYVHGNRIPITSIVAGSIDTIFIDETDWVDEGQQLIRLNRNALDLQITESRQSLAATVRRVAGYFAQAQSMEAEVALKNAEWNQARLNLRNRDGLSAIGAISWEEWEQYTTQFEVSTAALLAAQKNAEQSLSLIRGVTVPTHPEVLEAAAKLQELYLSWVYCDLLSPSSGFAAKRRAEVGEMVLPGQGLIEVVPLDEIWIEANYKETQLKRLRTGQPVTFTADMHGHQITYHGKVVGFQPGSGVAFAVLPPQNASGNWIKIVQRVPVRISVDPQEIKQYPLLLGVSLHVKVDTHDDSQEMLVPIARTKALYETNMLTYQRERMELLAQDIDLIIAENMQQGFP